MDEDATVWAPVNSTGILPVGPRSGNGLLSVFVGMITDSRSFMSYPRHEYFRRVLCNLVGRDVENGEIPDDETLLGPMIRNAKEKTSSLKYQ